jgi:hypothetical protein
MTDSCTSPEEQTARDALWRKASGLFDATLMWPNGAPSWNGLRDGHVIFNVRSEFLSAAILGKQERMAYLAEHYWPADQREGAQVFLERLYRSVRGETTS